MKEITILSGKGGAGKTSITAGFASLAKNIVLCDNDVDASDLHLITNPEIINSTPFNSGWILEINNDLCSHCNKCVDLCRFNAIQIDEGEYTINPFSCEGCRLCERECPSHAISSKENTRNSWFVSHTRFGSMVHAIMAPGEENSGKLVSFIRKKARELAEEKQCYYLINDGPPGIGCTAISSITGTDLVVVVIEPSESGIHDAKRLIDLVKTFNIATLAIINKSDINISKTNELRSFLNKENIPCISEIPFDEDFVHSMVKEQTIVEYLPNSDISKSLTLAWNKIDDFLTEL